MSEQEKLAIMHTNLGMLCGALARDDALSRKTSNVFQTCAWQIYEQVKRLRSTDLTHSPVAYLSDANREVEEACTACERAAKTHLEADAAAASIETHQGIGSVNGILGQDS